MPFESIFLVLTALYAYLATAQFLTKMSENIAQLDRALPQCQSEETEFWLRSPDLNQVPPCHIPRLDHNLQGHSPAFCFAAGGNTLCHD